MGTLDGIRMIEKISLTEKKGKTRERVHEKKRNKVKQKKEKQKKTPEKHTMPSDILLSPLPFP